MTDNASITPAASPADTDTVTIAEQVTDTYTLVISNTSSEVVTVTAYWDDYALRKS